VKKRTFWIVVAGVAAVSIGAAGVGLVAFLLRGPGGLSFGGGGSRYLELKLDGAIPEAPPPTDLGPFADRRPPSLHTLVEALDRASGDPKIEGVVLRIGLLEAGWGQAQELREAIRRYRSASRKPAIAYLEFATNKEYYLASACSKIYAAPTALIYVTGLAAEVTFFRGSLDKLGVEAQFEGFGKYKNAPNQFTESGFTDPHREQMNALVDSLYAQYVEGLSAGRKKTPDEIRTLLNEGPYDGTEAQKVGLVDSLVYRDQVEKELKGASRETPGHYVRGARKSRFLSRPKIALVYAVGEIASGSSQSGFGGTVAGAETVSQGIREARDDDSVKAIVLRVDSPGGSGTASETIWREIELAKRVKPVIASMGDVAASGGYYIAMGSDAIVAEPGTITGSIGVFSGKFSLRGLYDKLGVSEELVTRGDNADLFSEYRPWSSEERARIRLLMRNFYQDFVQRVAEGRKKPKDDVDAIAQGRVWSGAEALKNGLVDRMGGLDAALSLAKERARVQGGDYDVVILPEGRSFFETFLSRGEEEETKGLPVELEALWTLGRALADRGPIARLPFDLKVR
jgi:protease-4